MTLSFLKLNLLSRFLRSLHTNEIWVRENWNLFSNSDQIVDFTKVRELFINGQALHLAIQETVTRFLSCKKFIYYAVNSVSVFFSSFAGGL